MCGNCSKNAARIRFRRMQPSANIHTASFQLPAWPSGAQKNTFAARSLLAVRVIRKSKLPTHQTPAAQIKHTRLYSRSRATTLASTPENLSPPLCVPGHLPTPHYLCNPTQVTLVHCVTHGTSSAASQIATNKPCYTSPHTKSDLVCRAAPHP